MSTTFQRAPLTNHLRWWLAEKTTFECGDGVIPKESGWTGSQPNAPGSKFIPYTILTTMSSIPAPMTGSIADPQEDWHISYLVQSYSVTRESAERLADKVRIVLGTLRGEVLDLETDDAPVNKYKVQQVWVATLSGVNVTPGSDPMFYGQQDQYTLWLAKRRT